MSILGNILWIIFGGFFISFIYCLFGLMLCITIIGIPWGLQLFKLAAFALVPFGKQVFNTQSRGGCVNTLFNIVWVITGGLCIAAVHLVMGLLLCITIIGIPFGLQHFKLMELAFTPFGKTF